MHLDGIRLRKFLYSLCLLLSLTGCALQPLYGERERQISSSSESPSLQEEIRHIKIGPISDSGGRYLRNELLFLLGGGKEPSTPLYELRITAAIDESELAVEVKSDVPLAKLVDYHVRFYLKDRTDGKTLFVGSAHVSTTYYFRSQRFANKRAYRDAEKRLAVSAAQDIYMRLLVFFKERSHS